MKPFLPLLFIFFSGLSPSLYAQIWNGKDSLYGNEWINHNQSYFKLTLSEDGIYRIGQSTLINNLGITTVQSIPAAHYRLYRHGQEIPIYTSVQTPLGSNDFIEFYGKKNRGEVDKGLFKDHRTQQLNPEYSMYSDTSSYYLTWADTPSSSRFQSIANDLTNPPAQETICWVERVQLFTTTLIKPYIDPTNVVRRSEYETEGYSGVWSTNQTVTLSSPQAMVGVDSATLEVQLGLYNNTHYLELKINGNSVKQDTLFNSIVKKYSFKIAPNALTVPINLNVFNNNATLNKYDQHSLASTRLVYPHSFNFEGKENFIFTIPSSNTTKYLEIDNFQVTADVVLYDLTNNLRLVASVENGKIKIVLPPSIKNRQLLLVSKHSLINQLQKNTFIDYSNQNAQYVIISSKRLANDEQGNNPLKAYSDYRSSIDGGNYSTNIIYVEDLYEQFSYGINRHPLAVRSFVQYVNDKWKGSLQYILLVGKAREYYDMRQTKDIAANQHYFFVPTFGFPGSDNLLVSDNYTPVPAVPVGRIPAINTKEIIVYLEKIKDYEKARPYNQENQEWVKRAIFLSGGSSLSEQQQIAGNMRAMAYSFEKSKIGGKSTIFYKTSTDPIQISVNESIFKMVKEGISFVNFFGHSAASVLDFSADDPTRYEITEGRYPAIIALGCGSGNIHTSNRGVGERFVFIPNKGCHSFMATTGIGYVSALFLQTFRYYELLGGNKYGLSNGQVIRQAIKEMSDTYAYSPGIPELMAQFTICGDPALKIKVNSTPD